MSAPLNRVNLVGDRVRYAREHATPALTQDGLANEMNATGFAAGMDQKKVSLIESGARQVNDGELLALSHALNVSVHWLLGDQDHRPVLRAGDDTDAKRQNAAYLLQEIVIENRRVMQRWAAATNQSAQLDSGYLTQHLISLITGIPGAGRRGKGLDFADGSEAKSASDVDNVDRARWNHSFPTSTKSTKAQKVAEWLSKPYVFYAYWEIIPSPDGSPAGASGLLQVRAWAVKPQTDPAYQALLKAWRDDASRGYNFQLHPPRAAGSNIATNESGNIELPLLFLAVENALGQAEVRVINELATLGSCRSVARA